ncbi:hypothetical protein MKX03_011608, partial [Papaver bracteatum]
MREHGGLDEKSFNDNGVKQCIIDDVYKEVVPTAKKYRKHGRTVENGTTTCLAISGYSSKIKELEQQV